MHIALVLLGRSRRLSRSSSPSISSLSRKDISGSHACESFACTTASKTTQRLRECEHNGSCAILDPGVLEARLVPGFSVVFEEMIEDLGHGLAEAVIRSCQFLYSFLDVRCKAN